MKWLAPLILALAAGQCLAGAVLLDMGGEGPVEVLLVGGAYDGEEVPEGCPGDGAPTVPGASDNAIYLLDAATGVLLWMASGSDAVPAGNPGVPVFRLPQLLEPIKAQVTPVDSDGNGLVDRAYVADTGGTLWRIMLPEAGRQFRGEPRDVLAGYSVTAVAELGGDNRRFTQQADYVRSRDSAGDYTGILLVSGAWPGRATSRNFAYLVKDRGGPVVSHDELPDITGACASRDNPECASVDLRRGWKLALGSAGEAGVSRPLVSRGVVYFSTWLPPAPDSPCSTEAGEGEVYAVLLADGSPVDISGDREPAEPPLRTIAAGPGRPAPVLAWGDKVLLPGPGLPETRALSPGGPFRWRIYWREDGVDSR